MSSSTSVDLLFTPWKIGNVELKHRIVMAPLTRNRASKPSLSPNDLMSEYYEQRASDGGLLITEATYASEESGGYPTTPGLFTKEHVEGWKKVTEKVHAKGGKIFTQLWSLGRAQGGDTGIKQVSSGDLPIEGSEDQKKGKKPTPLTLDDIKRYQASYADSAKKAIEAGFDGIEIHGAHGYLFDQFTQTSANNRTDEYGGSKENRARFLLETLKACSDAIGEDKVGVRLSPYSHFQGMYNEKFNPDNKEVFLYICEQIHKNHPNFGYVHMVESRADPAKLAGWAVESAEDDAAETLDAYRRVFEGSPTAFLSAGGYTADIARKVVEAHGGAVVFGRLFISNPDLPERLKHGHELAKYDRSTFYTNDAEGYTTYEAWSQPQTRAVSPSK